MSRCSLLAVALLAAAPLAHAETSGTGTGDPELEPTEQAIIGGTTVPAGKWPDAVAVLGATGTCTGTLIAPDVVLTAGHCVETNPTRVIANTVNFNAPGGASAGVQRATAYPGWETSYDVAVLVLAKPIAGVTPRKLGTACTFEQGFAAGTQVHLVGFGSTDLGGTDANTRLNEVTAPVTDPDCTAGAGCVAAIAPGGEFVAGGSGKDTCLGDSGGPVYLDTPRGPVVVGAVSRGLDNSPTACGTGGIYVRTDKIAAWIETTTGKQIATDTCLAGRGDDTGEPPEITGGCAAAGGGPGALAPLGLGLVLAALRRRRDP
jgi:uncharacterized protein (TIGR03382 family)